MQLFFVILFLALLLWLWIRFYNALPEERKKHYRIGESTDSFDADK